MHLAPGLTQASPETLPQRPGKSVPRWPSSASVEPFRDGGEWEGGQNREGERHSGCGPEGGGVWVKLLGHIQSPVPSPHGPDLGCWKAQTCA